MEPQISSRLVLDREVRVHASRLPHEIADARDAAADVIAYAASRGYTLSSGRVGGGQSIELTPQREVSMCDEQPAEPDTNSGAFAQRRS